jgi:CheY-like chemotaxis protein
MADSARNGLAGKRLLVVEDEYLIAADLAATLEEAGAEVVGPAGTVTDALELIQSLGERLDAAILDVNLQGERVYPVADALAARGVPYVLATGYDAASIAPAYADAPRCEKPVDRLQLARLLAF